MQSSTSNLPISTEMQQNLSLRIKDMLMGMIPDDRINDMIQKEISAFFTEENAEFTFTEESAGYHSDKRQRMHTRVSPFRAMVWAECSKHAKKMIGDFFENPESQFFAIASQEWIGTPGQPGGGYVNVGGALSVAMEERLKEHALEMASNMFRGIFASAVEASRATIKGDLVRAGVFGQNGQPI
jgi:hypothetical protein